MMTRTQFLTLPFLALFARLRAKPCEPAQVATVPPFTTGTGPATITAAGEVKIYIHGFDPQNPKHIRTIENEFKRRSL